MKNGTGEQTMSKEKQIEEMAKVMAEGLFYEPNANQIRLFIDEAEALYNAGYRKQSEWISVEDGLPDKQGTYLTYTDKDNVDLDIFCIYPSHGTKFWSGERRGKVTHWMPLPEAPKIRLWS